MEEIICKFPDVMYQLRDFVDNEHFYVYRLYDTDGKIMYVGQSEHVVSRLNDHWRSKRSMGLSFFTLEAFNTRREAKNREAGLVFFCQPPLNRVGLDRRIMHWSDSLEERRECKCLRLTDTCLISNGVNNPKQRKRSEHS
jgi:hypothetical protein